MDPARAQALLDEHRTRIEQDLLRLGRSDSGEVSDLHTHMADAAEELYEDERDAGIAAALREELAAIERAQERLREGTFGISIESGEPIPDGRLEAIPWAERTAEEQARYERALG